MKFESKKFENISLSILFGCIVIIPLYIIECIYIHKIYNLTLINNDSLVLSYNVLQIIVIASTHYFLFSKGK